MYDNYTYLMTIASSHDATSALMKHFSTKSSVSFSCVEQNIHVLPAAITKPICKSFAQTNLWFSYSHMHEVPVMRVCGLGDVFVHDNMK